MTQHLPPALLKRALAGALLALTGLLAACGGGNSEPAPVKLQALDCSALQLASSSAEPLTHIALNGASALGIDETWSVEVLSQTGSPGFTTLAQPDMGPLALVSPVHPANTLAGGKVSLRLKSDRQVCNDLSFNIEAMAPAPTATFATEVAPRLRTLAALVQAQLGAGLAPDALLNTSLADLPVHAKPAALLATLMQQADAIAAAYAALPETERVLSDTLLARQGLVAELDGLIQAFQTAPAVVAAAAPVALTGASAQASRMAAQAIMLPTPKALEAAQFLKAKPAAGQACLAMGSVNPALFSLQTPEDLSDYIKVARQIKQDTSGPLFKLQRQNLATAFSALGLAPLPVGGAVGSALTWTVFAMDLINQMRANLYPNELSEITFEMPKTRIEEDWNAFYQDPPVKWHTAKLFATNSGMGLLRPTVDALYNKLGLSLPTTQGTKIAGWLGDQRWQKAFNNRLDQIEKDTQDDAPCFTIGTTRFGPVLVPDDTQDTWLESQTLGDTLVYNSLTREVAATQIGTGQLELKSRAKYFPGPVVFARKEITVPRKTVRFLPSTPYFVQNPGEIAELRFRFDDTAHAELVRSEVTVTDSKGNEILTAGHFMEGKTVHIIRIPTPANRDRYPLTVEATSTSITLNPVSPPRSSTQQLVLDERLALGPTGVCLARGDTQRFVATYTGADPSPQINWTVVSGGGSLGAGSGLEVDYTAPASDGTVTLRVSLASDSHVKAELSFQVGKCVGMAVYYKHQAQVSFPGRGVGCMGDDNRVADQEEDTTDRIPDMLVPALPAHFWFGRSSRVNFDPVPSGTRQRGISGNVACVTESFAGRSTLDSTLQASDAGNRLDVAINATASNTCRISSTSNREECTSSLSNTGWVSRYEIELTEAASYRVRVTMACTRDLLLPEAMAPFNLSISIYRFGPDGTVVMTHRDLQRAFLPPSRNYRCVDAASSVNFDQTVPFDAPAAPEQKDRVVVMVYGGGGAAALGTSARGTSGLIDKGSMNGFVEVTRATP
jgi:hypothetical protein